jgi:hypothetical protein
MSHQTWDELTPDEKELARIIERKWLTIARCTDRIDRQQATDAINAVYFSLGFRKEPKIIFADSPPAANEMAEQRDKYTDQLSSSIYTSLHRLLIRRTREYLICEENIRDKIKNVLPGVKFQKKSDGSSINPFDLLPAVSVQFWAFEASFLDLACSFGCYFAPGFPLLQEKWEALQLLVTHCGFIVPFQDICFVSDRPTELIFKDDFILHAVDQPAVVFSDGYKIYVENGAYLSDSSPYLGYMDR